VLRDHSTIAVGACVVEIALKQAGEKTQGATLASDSFFPSDDSVCTTAKVGVTTQDV